MSMKPTDIEIKIARDNVPESMPTHYKKACTKAYFTHILDLNVSIDLEMIPTTKKDLMEHILPFLSANPHITQLVMRLESLDIDTAQALVNSTTLTTIGFFWSILQIRLDNLKGNIVGLIRPRFNRGSVMR